MTAGTVTPGRSIIGRAAVAGIGESEYFKHGRAAEPEFKLTLRAILAACRDAGVDPKDIDGFCSYGDDRNLPDRLAAALGIRELRLANMHWTSGGGGSAAAVANAAAAVAVGYADCVVAFRGLAQGQFGRFGRAQVPAGHSSTPPRISVHQSAASQFFGPYVAPYGVTSAAALYAPRVQRMIEKHGVDPACLEAVATVSYRHASNNPRSVMAGRHLSHDDYATSRFIAEPFHLFDCCQETDGAAAMVVVPADRVTDLTAHPVYVLGAAQGGGYRSTATVENDPGYGANLLEVSKRLWQCSGVSPEDVDVAQFYDNFTGGVVLSIVEHGFCGWEEANDLITVENLSAPAGRLPINTSGGNIGEAYVHGLNLTLEAVRQLRGEAVNQVPGATIALSAGGPMTPITSTLLLGRQEALG